MVEYPTSKLPQSGAWYRSDQARARSVYRRANPWYRRLARGVVGLALLGAAGFGVFLAAREIRDYLERDRLPSTGVEVPEIASASFQITSSAPSPVIDGTLTIDFATGAFEFVGTPGGAQSGTQVVTPNGTSLFIRQGTAAWRGADDDGLSMSLLAIRPYLTGVVSADDVLGNGLRKGYIDLLDKVTEGIDPNAVDRYDMLVNFDAFASRFPTEWEDYRADVEPAANAGSAVPLTLAIDESKVVVRFRNDQTRFAWQRLTYSAVRFQPIDPTGVAVMPTVPPTAPPSVAPGG
jgi:hypothetical protein